jgi:RNase P/RNase MRP subunit POP5
MEESMAKTSGGTAYATYARENMRLFQQRQEDKQRIQQLLETNNQYLEQARAARRETEALRLTLAAVESQRDHLAAIVAAGASGNLKQTLQRLFESTKETT